jgi:hypothetical protein
MTRRSLFALTWLTCTLPCVVSGQAGQKSSDLWGEHWREDLVAWRHAKSPAAKRQLGETLIDSAMKTDKPALVEAVIAGGERQLRESEIHVPNRAAQRITLTTLREFPELRNAAPDHWPAEASDWLARRITSGNFEVWSPLHGWLFDRAGQLLNEAKPPRRDGVGREWFGAFLPDGRWITTDLWEFDKVLTFFSREGKWLKEIPGCTLVPRTPEDEKDTSYWHSAADFLITWARSDQDGRGWIVQVGDYGGRGRLWIGPDGPAQPLAEAEGMGWSRCYPRQLGPRGSLYWARVPNDSGKVILGFHVLPHGYECGYPQYFTGESPDYGPTVRIPGGENEYGFWPGSTSFFVVATHQLPPIKGGAVDEQSTYPTEMRTWFFDRDADFQGWIRAERLADGADGRSMLFRTKDNRVVTLDRQRRVRRVERFVFAAGVKRVTPLVLYPDLRLGLFRADDRFALARW